jgi:outer membrane lipoprotein-sorting protein
MRNPRRTLPIFMFGVATFMGLGDPSSAADPRANRETVDKTKSIKIVVSAEKDGKSERQTVWYRQNNLLRREQGKDATQDDYSITIVDLKSRELLHLVPKTKVAQRRTMDEKETRYIREQVDSWFALKDTLASDKGAKVRDLGEENLRNRKAHVYEITNQVRPEVKLTYKLWVDPKTQLPLLWRISSAKDSPTMMSDFTNWNEKLDDKLFDLKVPEGYRLVELPEKK